MSPPFRVVGGSVQRPSGILGEQECDSDRRRGRSTRCAVHVPPNVLRGLDYLHRAGVAPDERVAEAIALVASKRDESGRWPLAVRHPGSMPIEIDEGEGRPSRWNTLRALRVLHWYAARD